MARARFHKTLFIPRLEGQYLLWKKEISVLANRVDEIIQFGNSVGCNEGSKDSKSKGPNNATLEYTALYRSTFSNWLQLIGPNEILALNFPDEWTNNKSNRILRKRLLEKDQKSFVTAGVSKKRLVTHGGLTYGLWVELGRPQTAKEAADLLNKRYDGSLYFGDCYKLGDPPNYSANPVFADALYEVYPSWITSNEPMPFNQVHGSEGLNSLTGRAALTAEFSLFEFVEKISYTDFGSIVQLLKGGSFLNVSPDIHTEERLSKLPQPWRYYIERTPILDLRDELFDS
jgi:hypothetical protein